MPHSSADFFAAIDPVVNREFYGLDEKVDSQFSKIFSVASDDEPQKSAVEFGGPGVLQLKTENASVQQKSIKQSGVKSWTAATYAGACTISYEAAKDVKYGKIRQAAGNLGRATKMTPEYLSAQLLDNSYSTSYPTGWDGLPLCSTAHLLPDGLTTTSNALSAASSLDETAVEDLMTQMRNVLGPDGMRAPQQAKQLVVPSALWATATKLSMSEKTVGSANNDPSVIKGLKVEVFDYLSSSTRWFIQTKNDNGLFWDWIEKTQFITDQVPLNLQKVYVAFFRSRVGCVDWRGIFGSNAS
jgi:phage major head subunit gpT-like protein